MEIWKNIKGYENYQASSYGRIKNIKFKKERFLKFKNINGYNEVTLYKNGVGKIFYIHRLVGKIFLYNQENKSCINHKNGIKNDNRLENLEWCTYSENSLHSLNILKNKHGRLGKYGIKYKKRK